MLSAMDNQEKTSAANSISRPELFWLWGAIVAGSIFRLAFPGRIAIEHFDEGVYASNLWFGAESDYSYPARFLYAPPFLPAAIEWTMILASLCGIKPTGFIPMIPSLAAGIAMIPSVWWVGRRWFGPVAGLVSAWLIATSDFHASYSRAALTDVPVCLFILWAVYFIGQAFQATAAPISAQTAKKPKAAVARWSPPWRVIFLAGGFTGLAWWTKYNGWLPLAIGFAGGALWQLLLPPAERQIRRVVVSWLLIAAIAGLCWSPVLWGLQKHGGYATVAANHRNYVVGMEGWTRSAVAQIDIVRIYENPLSSLYSSEELTSGQLQLQSIAPQARADFGLIRNGQLRSGCISLFRTILPVLSLLVIPLGVFVLSAGVCLVSSLDSSRGGGKLPVCLVVAWLMGMSFATPFYHPYPRLILPWLCSIWLCLGMGFEFWNQRRSIGRAVDCSRIPYSQVSLLATGLILIAAVRQLTGSGFAWQDRSAIQAASKAFASTIRQETARAGFPQDEAIVYVIGEPALVFGLKSEGLPAVGPEQDLSFLKGPAERPTFVAYSSRDSSMPRDVRDVLGSPKFQSAATVTLRQSHLVELDEGVPNTITGNQVKSEMNLVRRKQ